MFEHLCREKSGPIWRAVWMPLVSVDWANRMIDRMAGVENFLSADPYTLLLDPSNKFFQVDDVGVIAVLPVKEWITLLHVHVTFWDRRLRGREDLCRNLALWICRFTGKQLFTQIPEDRRALVAFARRSGFHEQGLIGSRRILLFTNYTE